MTALITGASTGFGAAFAPHFAKDGHDLVLVSRNSAKLEAIAQQMRSQFGVTVTVIPRDLSVPGAAAELANELSRREITIDCLVNNAGFGLLGQFVHLSLSEQLGMIELNVTALSHLTGLLLPGMIERGRGRILNVSSTAAFQPGPKMAVYYATKAFVLSFSEALSEEVRGTGVTVTVSCPGPVATPFQVRAGTHVTRVRKLIPHVLVNSVVTKSYRGMMAGRRMVIPGLFNAVGVFSIRFMPRWLALKVIGFINT